MHVQGEKLKFHLSTARQAAMRDWCLTYLYLWYKYGSFRKKNKQAVDLVKSHLLYTVREEVEVLKEKIKKKFS